MKRISRKRGAALVEAAAVLPVMVVFLGCIMMAHKIVDTKLDEQQAARAGVLYYGSHSCKETMPNNPAGSGGGESIDTGQSQDNPADKASGKLDGQNNASTSAGLSRNYMTAKIYRTKSVSGSAVLNGKRESLGATISAGSQTACNEESFPSKWKAVVQFVGTFARGGGGFP